MDDLDPELCAQVYVDTEYRKKWDTYVMGKHEGGGVCRRIWVVGFVGCMSLHAGTSQFVKAL